MNYQRYCSFALLTVVLTAASCSDSLDSPENYSVNEACVLNTGEAPPEKNLPAVSDSAIDSDAELWNAIGLDNSVTAATRISGSIPAPDVDSTNSLTFAMGDEVIVADRSESILPLTPQGIPSGKSVGAYLLQFEGINEYMVIPAVRGNELIVYGPQTSSDDVSRITAEYDAASAAGIKMTVRIYLLNDGEVLDFENPTFSEDADHWMYPEKEKTSATDKPVMKPQALGGGAMQMTLQWNQANDLDFWLLEPDGHVVTYLDKHSTSNPVTDVSDPDYFTLDRDDVDGYGAENIRFPELPADGTYELRVNKYSGTQDTNYYVSVRACGQSVFYRGSLGGETINPTPSSGTAEDFGPTDLVLRFVVEGDSCTIQIPPPDVSSPDFIESTALCDIPSKNYVIIGNNGQ